MRRASIARGLPGHPLHPPLTDVTIGAYAVSTVCAVIGALGVSEASMATVWWIALLVGLVATGPTALTGLADWLQITRGTPLWRTATFHLAANLVAAPLFALAAVFGHGRYVSGHLGGGSLALTVAGFAVLLAAGWLGGTIVFVHGMRVLSRQEEPARRAVVPRPAEPRHERRERATHL